MSLKRQEIVGHPHRVIGEEADEERADDERADLDDMPRAALDAVDQEADADHLAGAEGVGEAEERHRRHAPRHDVVAGRDVDAERAAGRQHHHQDEDENEEAAGREAGNEIEAIEKLPRHAPSPAASITTPPPARPDRNDRITPASAPPSRTGCAARRPPPGTA